MSDPGDFHGYRGGTGGWRLNDVAVIRSASVTLTNAQIKALPTTPVTLVPAPGAGKALLIERAALIPSFVADGGYEVGVDASLQFVINNGVDTQVALATVLNGNGTGQTYLTALLGVAPQSGTPAIVNPEGVYDTTWPGMIGSLGSLANAPLLLVGSDEGDFTGGDPANTMTVTVLYTVLDV